MSHEIPEDAYTLTPCGQLGGKTGLAQGGKFLGEFDDNESALEFVKERMEEEKFWPDIIWVSDHGNWWHIDVEGNEIHVEDDEEDEDWDGDYELRQDEILERQELEDFEGFYGPCD